LPQRREVGKGQKEEKNKVLNQKYLPLTHLGGHLSPKGGHLNDKNPHLISKGRPLSTKGPHLNEKGGDLFAVGVHLKDKGDHLYLSNPAIINPNYPLNGALPL